MKYTDLQIPDGLQALFSELVAAADTAPGATGTARTRRSARRAAAPKSLRRVYAEWLQTADWLADLWDKKRGTQARLDFIYARIAELRIADFNPKYWQKCVITGDQYRAQTATPDPTISIPPYSYRDTSKLPGPGTYEAGDAGTPPSRFAGTIINQQWTDQSWTWRHQTFQFEPNDYTDGPPPLIWRVAGDVTADATDRGSKPMFSLLMHARFHAPDSQYEADFTPPLSPATSIYWRFPPPASAPPYYHVTLPRAATISITNRAAPSDDDNPTRVTLKHGVRPMLGLGYNNNDTVTTSFNGDSNLYEPNYPSSWIAYPALKPYPPGPQYSESLKINKTTARFHWRMKINEDDEPTVRRTTTTLYLPNTEIILANTESDYQQPLGQYRFFGHFAAPFWTPTYGITPPWDQYQFISDAENQFYEWVEVSYDFQLIDNNNPEQFRLRRKRLTFQGKLTILDDFTIEALPIYANMGYMPQIF